MTRIGVIICLAVSLALAQRGVDHGATTGYHSITANDLRAHLEFLASPELEGRETTLRGQKVAARYIASSFRRAGLAPIGDSGTYFQRFDVSVTRFDRTSSLTIKTRRGEQSFGIGTDYLPAGRIDTTITGTVVFMGHFDDTPPSGTDRLAKGRLVMLLAGSSRRDTSQGERGSARLEAYPGSLGTLLVADDTGSSAFNRVTRRQRGLLDRGAFQLAHVEQRGWYVNPNIFYITRTVAEAILQTEGRSLTTIRRDSTAPFVLSRARITVESRLTREIRQTENVVGLVEGSDPSLKEEAVIITAHYDHVGIGQDGAIYTGADDDGSGTATLLELARAFSINSPRPRRSIVFLAFTGEEKGLLGSFHYVTAPIIPLSRTVANLNMDMIGRVDKKYEEIGNPNYTYIIGSDKISRELDSLLHAANSQSENLILDYRYDSDRDPEQFYRRSDHFNFARNGIPVIFFFTGIHEDYHRPTDTVEKILFERMAKIGRLVYYTAWKVANFERRLARTANAASH